MSNEAYRWTNYQGPRRSALVSMSPMRGAQHSPSEQIAYVDNNCVLHGLGSYVRSGVRVLHLEATDVIPTDWGSRLIQLLGPYSQTGNRCSLEQQSDAAIVAVVAGSASACC